MRYNNISHIMNLTLDLISNVLLVSLVITIGGCVKDFPSSIERCKNEDKECLLNAWNKYIKLSGKMAIPELNIPNLHEHFVEKSIINAGGDVVNFKLTLLNSTLVGLDRITYTNITGFPRDPKTMTKFELFGFCPLLSTRGNYRASGKVLLLPLNGNGYEELQFFNITFKVTVHTTTEVIDGEEHLVISNVQTTYKSDRNHYRLDCLLNNKELSDSINNIFNESQDVINKELVAPISIAISKIFKQIFEPIFKQYPYRSFFLEA